MAPRKRGRSGDTGTSAKALIPPRPSLNGLRSAAAECRACELWRSGTQTVFGEGAPSAKVMLVGEQPGDREDQAGAPFVGPAGEVLDHALGEAKIVRGDTYVTNAVKHFKWTPGRGKRRLHQRPNGAEIAACRPWLESELAVVKPQVLVCLGATAAKALLGSKVRVTRDRGRFLETEYAAAVTVTIHPAAILRAQGEVDRREAFAEFVADLRSVARRLRSAS
jgi:uracil-DNA glycosylase